MDGVILFTSTTASSEIYKAFLQTKLQVRRSNVTWLTHLGRLETDICAYLSVTVSQDLEIDAP
ncbi:hypothetical protein EJ110_NYTH48123 [Nymphaea thermarum]|nr:hypothetical protein EJ110_NYTH48123 [Nymphaea thermarum]